MPGLRPSRWEDKLAARAFKDGQDRRRQRSPPGGAEEQPAPRRCSSAPIAFAMAGSRPPPPGNPENARITCRTTSPPRRVVRSAHPPWRGRQKIVVMKTAPRRASTRIEAQNPPATAFPHRTPVLQPRMVLRCATSSSVCRVASARTLPASGQILRIEPLVPLRLR